MGHLIQKCAVCHMCPAEIICTSMQSLHSLCWSLIAQFLMLQAACEGFSLPVICAGISESSMVANVISLIPISSCPQVQMQQVFNCIFHFNCFNCCLVPQLPGYCLFFYNCSIDNIDLSSIFPFMALTKKIG